jgi:hypothetical protein
MAYGAVEVIVVVVGLARVGSVVVRPLLEAALEVATLCEILLLLLLADLDLLVLAAAAQLIATELVPALVLLAAVFGDVPARLAHRSLSLCHAQTAANSKGHTRGFTTSTQGRRPRNPSQPSLSLSWAARREEHTQAADGAD